MTDTTDWDALPDTVRTFMTALDAREVDRASATLATDAVVTDEGHDYKGPHCRATLDGTLITRVVIEP